MESNQNQDLDEDEELKALRLAALATLKEPPKSPLKSADPQVLSHSAPINRILTGATNTGSEPENNRVSFISSSFSNNSWRKQNNQIRRRAPPSKSRASNLILISPVENNGEKNEENKATSNKFKVSNLLPQFKWCGSGTEDSMSPKTLRKTGPTRFNRHGSDSESSESDYSEDSESDSGSNETVLQDEPPQRFSSLSPTRETKDLSKSPEKSRRLSFHNFESDVKSDQNETTSIYNCMNQSNSSYNRPDSYSAAPQNDKVWEHSAQNNYTTYNQYSSETYSSQPNSLNNYSSHLGGNKPFRESGNVSNVPAWPQDRNSGNSYYTSGNMPDSMYSLNDKNKQLANNDLRLGLKKKLQDTSSKPGESSEGSRYNYQQDNKDNDTYLYREQRNRSRSRDRYRSEHTSETREQSLSKERERHRVNEGNDSHYRKNKREEIFYKRPQNEFSSSDAVQPDHTSLDKEAELLTDSYQDRSRYDKHTSSPDQNKTGYEKHNSSYARSRYEEQKFSKFRSREEKFSSSRSRRRYDHRSSSYERAKHEKRSLSSERNRHENRSPSQGGRKHKDRSSSREWCRHDSRNSSQERKRYKSRSSSQDRKRNRSRSSSQDRKRNRSRSLSRDRRRHRSRSSSQDRKKHRSRSSSLDRNDHRSSSRDRERYTRSADKRKSRSHSSNRDLIKPKRQSSSPSIPDKDGRTLSSIQGKRKRTYSSDQEKSKVERSASQDKIGHEQQNSGRSWYKRHSAERSSSSEDSDRYGHHAKRKKVQTTIEKTSLDQNLKDKSLSKFQSQKQENDDNERSWSDCSAGREKSHVERPKEDKAEQVPVVAATKSRLKLNRGKQSTDPGNEPIFSSPEKTKSRITLPSKVDKSLDTGSKSEKNNHDELYQEKLLASKDRPSNSGSERKSLDRTGKSDRSKDQPRRHRTSLKHSSARDRYARSRSSSRSSTSSYSSSSSHDSRSKLRSVPSVVKSVLGSSINTNEKDLFGRKSGGSYGFSSESDSYLLSKKDGDRSKSFKNDQSDVDRKASDSKRVPVHMRLGAFPRKRVLKMTKDVEAAFVNSSSGSDNDGVSTKSKRQTISITTDISGTKNEAVSNKSISLGVEKADNVLREKSGRLKTSYR